MDQSKIEQYKSKKIELESQLEVIKRDIILTEQSISQQEELFTQQFGTTDIDELTKISLEYSSKISEKEAELDNLINQVA